MIDLHSHILPYIDDGPDDWEESLELCQLMINQGIRTVVATPHYWPGLYQPSVQKIKGRVRELNQLLKEKGLDLLVLSGSEIHFCPEMNELLSSGEILTLNYSRYILLELPQQIEKTIIFEAIFQLQLAGYVPIIAHPEKNSLIQKDPSLMDQLILKGALGQITAASLLEEVSSINRHLAQDLLGRNCVQIIATDTHSTLSRPPLLKQSLEKAANLLSSQEKARQMVQKWPEKILQDQEFKMPDPIRQKSKKGFFSFIQEHVFTRT